MTDQQLGFDVVERNAILDRALAHASDEWQTAALTTIGDLAGTGQVFQATDCVRLGLAKPDHPARWGAVFSYAAKIGLIERVGYAPSARATVKGSVASTWRGAGVTPAPEGPPVKAISLSRPWTAYVLEGNKTIENRTWTTHHRGLLVIHAARSWDNDAAYRIPEYKPDDFPMAQWVGYVGVVELVDVCAASYKTGRDCECATTGWSFYGSYHWQLANPVPFDIPIPGRGRLGVWTPPLDVTQAARRAATSNRLERTA